MKLVVQRVTGAEVKVESQIVGQIGKGLMVLVGISVNDSEVEVRHLAAKTVALRIFDDENGVMNLSVKDIEGEILAVSQFTLLGDARKGNRPSYIRAMRPPQSEEYYELYCREVSRLLGKPVSKGIFGADMKVSLTNDGPVTILFDTEK